MGISKNNNSKKSFWKDKKNIAIVILSFLLFCFIITYPNSNNSTNKSKIEELTKQVNTIKAENDELNAKIEANNKQITDLQENNKTLTEENNNLKSEKQELSTKVEELQKTSSASSSTSTSSLNNSSQMVWVGNTGTKYHKQNCSTLKGQGHQITLQQAQAEGREPCNVCY